MLNMSQNWYGLFRSGCTIEELKCECANYIETYILNSIKKTKTYISGFIIYMDIDKYFLY